MEGALDAIAVTTGTAGRCVGIAACGTAVTPDHLELLARHCAIGDRRVVVALDDDPAGHSASHRLHQLASARGWTLLSAELPTGADPAGMLQTAGAAALTSGLLDQARPLVDVLIDRCLARWADRLRWVEGRIGALRDVADLVASLPPGQAALRANQLASVLDLDPTTVHREISSRLAPHTPPRGITRSRGAPHVGTGRGRPALLPDTMDRPRPAERRSL